nr:unnamed protein product [Digitaria exilis]
MQVVTGAMGSLLPKLGVLLREEYKLQKGVKKDIRFLSRELTMMHAALRKVADVPPDDLDPQLRLWAAQVRELSYDIEDVVDTFLVRVDNGDHPDSRGLAKKMIGLLNKGMTRREIAKEIRDIKDRVQEVADRRDRYKLDSVLANTTTSTATVDPRISALYKKATDLVGVDGARDELIRRLSPDVNKALKVVSVAGPGGLGKTTLAKSVFDTLKERFDCCAFVPLGRNPDTKKIEKNYLIWRWIAEGFICEKQGLGQYEVGERYFYDLINRSMIQPTERYFHNGTIVGCSVHDMVLDLIRSLSTHENFVAILDKEQDTLPAAESNVRRLAVQKRDIEEDNDPNASGMGMPQVRSFNATTCKITVMPQLSSFRVVRVLALEYCDFTESGYRLEHLGKLLHLRYLSLVNTPIAELPGEVGSLKFLLGLDVRRTGIHELPSTVSELKQLRCLSVDGDTRVPAGLGNLTKLEELRLHSIDKSPSFLAELAELTEVRDLEMSFHELDESSQQTLLASMCSLHKVQTLEIWHGRGGWFHIGDWEGWGPSSQLRELSLVDIYIPRLPSWIHSSRVPHLYHLHLGVELVETRDIDTIGKLPELRFLYLSAGNRPEYRPAGSDDGRRRRPLFRNLRHIQTNLQLTFPPGAMPALLVLRSYWVNVRAVADAAAAAGHGGGFDDVLGVGNLPSLKWFEVRLHCAGARLREVEEAEATFRRAVRMRMPPNSPAWCFGIARNFEEEMIVDDPHPSMNEDGHDNGSTSGDGADDKDNVSQQEEEDRT